MNKLQALFDLRPGEARTVGVMFLYSMFMVSGVFVIGRSLSRALFLSALPPEAIAYRFILPPLVIIGVAAGYSRLVRRYRLWPLILATTIFLISGALLFRLLLETSYGQSFSLLAALFIFAEIIVLLAASQFWAFSGEVFDARQAKRLLGLIGAGGTIANVVGGATLSWLASLMAPKNLIFVLVFCLAGCLACVWMLRPGPVATGARGSSATDPPKRKSLWQDIRALSQSPLLVAISSIAVLLIIIATIAEYQLDLALKRAYAADGGQISIFLGNLFFWAGLGACFMQFFVTSRILSRFGIIAALLFSPIGYGLGALAILVSGGMLWAVALPRAFDVMFRTTINSAATNLLYVPAPAGLRKQAKTLVQGVISPPVVIIVGLVFLYLRRFEGISLWYWAIPMLLLSGVWIVLTFRAQRQYTLGLAQNLHKSRHSLAEMSLDLNDDTAVQLLLDTLQHPDEVRVLVALHLLSEAPPGDWLPRLTPLLSHSDAGVRQVTARVLARSGSSAEAELLLRLGQTPGEPGRAEAIEAYCALRKEEALAQILPFLSEPDPAVQRATVVNLIRYGGLDGILPAVEVLKAMLSSPQTRVRLEATRALGELQIQTFYQPLIPLLDDPQLMVQLEAIRAAGAVRSLYLTPYLVQKLGNPATRGPASEALIQFGPAVEPLLAQTLADPGQDQAIRQAIPRILQKMASSQAAAILLNHFEEPDRVVRGAIFAALIRLREAGVHFEIEKQRIHEALTLEFGYYYEVFVWRTDLNLGPATSTGLLGEALTVRLNERLDRIFFLLELLYSVKTIDIIRAVLKDKDTSQRANAIELLDNIVTREIKMLLLPLIELPAEQVCDLARQRFGVRGLPWSERLGVLAGYPDPWLRSCAIFEIGQLRLHDLIEPILASQEVDDGLVRETAQLTRQRLTVPDQAQG